MTTKAAVLRHLTAALDQLCRATEAAALALPLEIRRELGAALRVANYLINRVAEAEELAVGPAVAQEPSP